VLAFVGLVENSSVVLVASMLVSPLMGPILAGVFGAVIQDRNMALKGVKHETQALLICIVVGFILGLCVCPVVRSLALTEWPTPEMISRGAPRSLVVGVLVAIPSGAGVALSVLGGNSGSLVGVAISASLLPPAVNAGFFWALAVHLAIEGDQSVAAFYALPGHNETILAYLPHYSSNLAVESLILGLVSLALTLVNILCIIVTGFGILRLKEVTPEKIPQRFSSFWRKDIKAHRNFYQTLGGLKQHRNQRDTTKDGLDGTFMKKKFDREDIINIRHWIYLQQGKDNAGRLDSSEDLVMPRSPIDSLIMGRLTNISPNQPYLASHSSYITSSSSHSSYLQSDSPYLLPSNFFQTEVPRSRFRSKSLTSLEEKDILSKNYNNKY